MKYRPSLLSATIAMCLGISMQAHAQDSAAAQEADTSGESATEFERVIVTGIRASLQQALDTKRNSDAIIDVITAEDVGKFPSTNVAEAITVLPGVTIDKAFGQGEKVSILGTDPALNRTVLNGQTVASADWFITDQPGRTFNYSLLAPQLVGKVEVYKSPEAWLDEGSIGGTVNISTRKPLDLDGTTISGSVSYLHNSRIGSGDPSVSALVGWKNDAGNFGALEILRIGPGSHRGAVLAIPRGSGPHRHRLDHITAAESQCRHLFVTAHCHLQAGGQRIGHAHPHAVQTAREAVRPARALVELAPRVQAREHDLDHADALFGMQAKGNAPPIVFHADRAIGVLRHGNALAKPRQRLVGRVVDHLLDDVQGVVGPGVHARTLLDGLQALENTDRTLAVFGGGLGGGFDWRLG